MKSVAQEWIEAHGRIIAEHEENRPTWCSEKSPLMNNVRVSDTGRLSGQLDYLAPEDALQLAAWIIKTFADLNPLGPGGDG